MLDETSTPFFSEGKYTADERRKFEEYLQGQIAKIDIPGKDVAFLRERILTMYANPLRNHIAASAQQNTSK